MYRFRGCTHVYSVTHNPPDKFPVLAACRVGILSRYTYSVASRVGIQAEYTNSDGSRVGILNSYTYSANDRVGIPTRYTHSAGSAVQGTCPEDYGLHCKKF